ncbi:sel1 repeat family protein, partial [Motilibacter sp. E257]
MIALANLLCEDRGDEAGAEQVLRLAAERGEPLAHNNLGVLLRDQRRLLEAEAAFVFGVRAGDRLAARNLRALRRTERRRLGRAHRRAARDRV